MKSYQKSLKHGSVSKPSRTQTDFEFPTSVSNVSNEVSQDVVFCGKVITRKTEPDSAPQMKRNIVVVAGIKSSSGRENRYRRNGSERKSFSGMFGIAKFPLQMELSDIKMRQERKVPMPLKFTAEEDGGGESCWEMVRPLQRQGSIMSFLKASFGCIRFI
ncbi:hypothetical protein TSUD_277840 [Trifolium subterraneum]|uniref:Uncharacterized protein n=1 Tax=Trifolium subterraneum TaxID=3900 RepID=A0A2Z6MI00_TRISU|nr:hypothetical protein TSUD_277840 [Trifolium subterraneum]